MPAAHPFRALGPRRTRGEVIAVDIGYSSKQPTCGLAVSWDDSLSMQYRFGDAVRRVADICRQRPGAVLALEAVLSTCHDTHGNPQVRGEFEEGRGWYWGPGAVTALAAIRFLSTLAELRRGAPTITLAEAFLSNKPERKADAADATLSAQEFWEMKSINPNKDWECISWFVKGVPPVRSFVYAR
jgi:hypothetical protein